MTALLDDLKNENTEAFEKWFKRWYGKSDLENRIKVSNLKGFTGIKIKIPQEDPYLQNRLSDIRALTELRKKLPGFTIDKNAECGDRMIFGHKLGTYRNEFIAISWKV